MSAEMARGTVVWHRAAISYGRGVVAQDPEPTPDGGEPTRKVTFDVGGSRTVLLRHLSPALALPLAPRVPPRPKLRLVYSTGSSSQ